MVKSILPMKTPCSYYGGKQRIASDICKVIHQIPHTVYSEPFCGGLAVLFQKGVYASGSNYREAINDTNKQLITFWRVAREHPQELERWIDLTPYSQEEHRRAREIYNNPEQFSDLEIAWAVYLECNMSFSNKVGAGWRFAQIGRNDGAVWQNRKDRLPQCFERLSQVHIGCEDALDFIKRWDSSQTLHYIDPPYPQTDQGHYKGYTVADFAALCKLLDTIEGSYLLSNYDQPVQPKSAQDCIEIEATMSAANGKKLAEIDTARIEKLWICDRSKGMRLDIAKIAAKSKTQLNLF